MTINTGNPGSSDSDLQRAAQETANRLRALGIQLTGRERPEELVAVEEAVERFEAAVEAKGGDLMMDESPPGQIAQPDDRHFALPLRNAQDSIADYLERLARATDTVRLHPGKGD